MDAPYSYGDYIGVVSVNNIASVYYRGELVWTSRPFRLRIQAEAKMHDYINQSTKQAQDSGITLDVHNMSIDANTLFGAKHNG